MLLTTHPLLVPRSWKSRAIPLPTLWATPACNGITLPLTNSQFWNGANRCNNLNRWATAANTQPRTVRHYMQSRMDKLIMLICAALPGSASRPGDLAAGAGSGGASGTAVRPCVREAARRSDAGRPQRLCHQAGSHPTLLRGLVLRVLRGAPDAHLGAVRPHRPAATTLQSARWRQQCAPQDRGWRLQPPTQARRWAEEPLQKRADEGHKARG